MNLTDRLNNSGKDRSFSIEVVPPLKGAGATSLFRRLDEMAELGPQYINITTHHSEYIYRELDNGQFERLRVRRRPGTIAIAAAIQQRYDIPVVPHLICSGVSKEQIEYELIDLQFLGITNVLCLRGDKGKEDRVFTPAHNGPSHATELIEQVNDYNNGFFFDGTEIKNPGEKFHYGVAAYPEKHEEAPNLDLDLKYLKMKQDLGAEYAVTQLFYDNRKYFAFVAKARSMGITMPIVPALKPFAKLNQITVVPRTFHCDLPQELAREALKCKSDDDARALGIEWSTEQCKQLYAAGVKNIHFFTVSAHESVKQIVKNIL